MAQTSIPNGRNDIINFYQQHAPIWASVTTSIGLTVEQSASVSAAADDAVAALAAAEAARNASKVATDALNAKAAALRIVGGAAMATIRAYAETTGDPVVYEKAVISPPAPPKPTPGPTSPTDLVADPNADGTISLKWKGTVANAQWFVIERSVNGGPWTGVKTLREKNWLDTAVPTNISVLAYRMFGQRMGQLSTDPVSTQVNFGTLPPELAAAFRTPKTEAA